MQFHGISSCVVISLTLLSLLGCPIPITIYHSFTGRFDPWILSRDLKTKKINKTRRIQASGKLRVWFCPDDLYKTFEVSVVSASSVVKIKFVSRHKPEFWTPSVQIHLCPSMLMYIQLNKNMEASKLNL